MDQAPGFKEEGAFSWGNASPRVVSVGTPRGSKPPELTPCEQGALGGLRCQ